MSEKNDLVHLHSEGVHWRLTLNRPAALNALAPELLRALQQGIETVAQAATPPRLLSIHGQGRAFVAGADIRAMQGLSAAAVQAYVALGQQVLTALESLPLPVVAAVHGVALGGGCELALACDLILAERSARFGQPEVKLGLVPGFGATPRLPRRVGVGMARYLLYTGATLDAVAAHRCGLVDVLCDEGGLEDALQGLAQDLVQTGRQAVAATKSLLLQPSFTATQSGLAAESEAFQRCFASPQAQEGIAAFVEKRPPRFV